MRIEHSRLQQVRDAARGLLGDPSVDALPGGLRVGGEIGLKQPGVVVRLHRVQESGQKGEVVLQPQRVGHVQPIGRLVSGPLPR